VEKREEPEARGRGEGAISRRTVIRTAAHAAWVVPVISAVSAAPAFATSQDRLVVSIDNPRWASASLTVRFTVQNTEPGNLDAGDVSIYVTIPGPNRSNLAQRFVISTPVNGWAIEAVNTSNNLRLRRSVGVLDNSSTSFDLQCVWQNANSVPTGTQVVFDITSVTSTTGGMNFDFSDWTSPSKP
jgi:hypothetical protein